MCFLIVTPWELGVILTANYTFLNYLVLALGFLLLDDRFLQRFLPQRWKQSFAANPAVTPVGPRALDSGGSQSAQPSSSDTERPYQLQTASGFRRYFNAVKLCLSGVVLAWIFYVTMAELAWMFSELPLPTSPVVALEPFRIANRYGLFGIMTRGRYEIEFQGSNDGEKWVAYPFRYKPQDVSVPPGIYAPYQPRFDWNLWFASLGSWQEYPIVSRTELRLLSNDRDVLNLFAKNPFPDGPPREVRAVLWQYWFTSMSEKRTQGLWWRREFKGLYAPAIEREPDGTIHGLEWPSGRSRARRLQAIRRLRTEVLEPGQRHFRRVIAAHAMNASAGRSGGRADVDIARRSGVAAPGRPKQRLTKVERSPTDIAAHKIRVHGLKIGGREDASRQNAVAETRSEAFNLIFEFFEHVYFGTVGHVTIRPGRVLAGWGTGAVEADSAEQAE